MVAALRLVRERGEHDSSPPSWRWVLTMDVRERPERAAPL